MMPMTTHQRHLESEQDTQLFAGELSLFLRPGMILILKGDLGAGKSTFARALINALSNPKSSIDIPSPTFALVQTYDITRIPVAHVDLYRTSSEAEIQELGLADLATSHLLIIEWPHPIVEDLDNAKLVIEFSGTGNSRDVEIVAYGGCAGLVSRLLKVDKFLSDRGWQKAERQFLDGDASSRRYERLKLGQSRAILMDMPRKADGPPVKDGKSYSAIAHLAEGLRSVVAVNEYLVEQGYAAPEIIECDIGAGFALIDDFGNALYGRMRANGEDMGLPMQAAVDVLASMANQSWPAHIAMRDQSIYNLPSYDTEAQLIEVDLLASWYFPHIKAKSIANNAAEEFLQLWKNILGFTSTGTPVWVLRDFHSPNLIWRPEQSGLKKVGLIDTQDALLGHPAYDLVSLLQDARIDISVEEEASLYAYYVERRQSTGPFNSDDFARTYAVLGAQRATKILGIFARLAKRDGKLAYLKNLPRVSLYLERNLRHPALADLRRWYKNTIPEAIGLNT
jgi:tRNA threonylcarbamoyl adenosine modification protein YjeE